MVYTDSWTIFEVLELTVEHTYLETLTRKWGTVVPTKYVAVPYTKRERNKQEQLYWRWTKTRTVGECKFAKRHTHVHTSNYCSVHSYWYARINPNSLLILSTYQKQMTVYFHVTFVKTSETCLFLCSRYWGATVWLIHPVCDRTLEQKQWLTVTDGRTATGITSLHIGKPHTEQNTSSEAKLKATSFPSAGLI